MIEMTLLRQAYNMKKTSEGVCIPSTQNPSHALTKDNASPTLKIFMDRNVVDISPKSFIERHALHEKPGLRQKEDIKYHNQ